MKINALQVGWEECSLCSAVTENMGSIRIHRIFCVCLFSDLTCLV